VPAPVDRRRRSLCLAVLSGLTFAGCAEPPAAPRAGDKLPELRFSRLDGAPASLAEHAGSALVLNLWATWCAPCRAEMPSLQRLADLFAAGDLAVVAISIDDDLNLVREFLLRYAIRFPVYADTLQPPVRSRLGVTAYPTTLLLRRDGRIAEVVTGERDWAAAAMIAHLEALLEVQSRGRAPP
jgi:thiol-disulfide isomerase/thioredoxin